MFTMISFLSSRLKKRRGKHSHGRQNASSFRDSIVTADRMLPQQDEVLQRPTEYQLQLRKYPNGRQSTRCCRMEYSDSRQSTSYNCGNTLTADRMPASIGWSTPTADRMLPRTDGVLRRASECFRDWKEYSDGRHVA